MYKGTRKGEFRSAGGEAEKTKTWRGGNGVKGTAKGGSEKKELRTGEQGHPVKENWIVRLVQDVSKEEFEVVVIENRRKKMEGMETRI